MEWSLEIGVFVIVVSGVLFWMGIQLTRRPRRMANEQGPVELQREESTEPHPAEEEEDSPDTPLDGAGGSDLPL